MNTQYLKMMQTPAMMDALINSSVSVEDANLRSREYAKMFSRNEDMKDIFGLGNGTNLLQKTFSGYAETPLLSTQYFNASVASYVSSFAGYMSIERDFDQPNGLFYWFDVLGVSDMRSVIPNLGPDNYQDINTMGGFEFSVTPNAGQTQYSQLVIGRKLIPGTIRVKIVDVDTSTAPATTNKFELIDNGQGVLMSIPGVLTAGTINYLSGRVDFTLTNASVAGNGSSITIIGKEDVTGTPCNTNGANNSHANDKRFIAKMQQIGLSTVPDMLVAEYNIAALGAMKKATGADMATFLFGKLREIYTKAINYKLVSTLEEGYVGDTLDDLDLSINNMSLANKFHDYRSRVDLFDAYLINVETVLANKAVKGVDVTCYVAGPQACNQFQKGGIIGKWQRNTKMTYISDLLGWYDGIPVLRSTDIVEPLDQHNNPKGTFYAIHKTKDGQMAPLARGIYMPLTDTPTIGNYNNPTQMASGIYYQEGTKYMAQELVQKVEFSMGL
jgi:hypothetical protein